MMRNVLTLIVAWLLVFFSGCSGASEAARSSPQGSYEIVRKEVLASKWQLYHLQIEVAAGNQLPIVLKLADGDRVDGYFYLVKGDNIDFQITGSSLLYKSAAQDAPSRKVISDRFSFAASQAQASTYTLTFRNSADKSSKPPKVTIFLELIYPVNGAIFVQLETKGG